jgi:hypothetical protein
LNELAIEEISTGALLESECYSENWMAVVAELVVVHVRKDFQVNTAWYILPLANCLLRWPETISEVSH